MTNGKHPLSGHAVVGRTALFWFDLYSMFNSPQRLYVKRIPLKRLNF